MTERGKQPGNIGELLTMGMCVLALTVVMLNYLQNVQLLQAKENVGQLARAYLLKMETVGYLEPAEQAHLTAELETAGLTEIDYEGSTLEPAGKESIDCQKLRTGRRQEKQKADRFPGCWDCF